MKIVYLKPRSSFRDYLRSDSLWGLICWGIKNLWSEETLLEMISGYQAGFPLKVSSAFRWVDTPKGRVRLFPKPLLPPFDLQELVSGLSKKDKVARFARLKDWRGQKTVSEDVFLRFLSGDLDEKGFFSDENLWNPSDFWRRFKSETTIHNSINRLTCSTNRPEGVEGSGPGGLYSRDDIFALEAGLFFLLDGEPKYISMAEAALRYYSHTGFMGDSSTGKNHFDIKIDEFQVPEVKDPTGFVSLSLFIPSDSEAEYFSANPGKCFYEMETRKGKVSSAHLNPGDFWKKSVISFKEGATFPAIGKNGYGVLRKVKEVNQPMKFSVYQSGIAFNLPGRIL